MLENLRNKSEEYRKKFALGVSSGVFLVMFFSWAYFNGFLGFSTPIVAVNSNDSSQSANVDSSGADIADNNKPVSPFDSTKSTLSGVWNEIDKQYESVRDSMASVLVPFVTNIDVYQRTK